MLTGPQNDPEIQAMQSGMKKAPKQILQLLSKIFKVGKKGVIKGVNKCINLYKQRRQSTIQKNSNENVAKAFKQSLNKEQPVKASSQRSQKPQLKKVIASAVKLADKQNSQLTQPSKERTTAMEIQ